jgi:hypothetical protein
VQQWQHWQQEAVPVQWHPRGLKHGMVDAINCFDVVAVSGATYQAGPNLIKIYNAINTRHCSICDEALQGLLQPSSCHVVGSSRLTRMSRKEIVGQRTMDGSTTTYRYSHSIERDTGRLEERSACSVGNVGGICTIDVGESWASGHVDIVLMTPSALTAGATASNTRGQEESLHTIGRKCKLEDLGLWERIPHASCSCCWCKGDAPCICSALMPVHSESMPSAPS